MLLTAYNLRDLQILKGLLLTAKAEKISIDGLLSKLSEQVAKQPTPIINKKPESQRALCPSCGLSNVLRLVTIDGLLIFECVKCSYSKIIHEDSV